MRQAEPIPYDIALIMGDAIHNFRSALDHMFCELVQDEYAQFPVRTANTKASFCKLLRPFSGKRHVVDFIKALQPYPGGAGIAIVDLHEIDIIDKHRILLPMGQVKIPSFRDTTILRGSTITLLSPNRPHPMADGDIFARIDAVDSLTAGDELNCSFNIAFARGTCFKGEPVTPLLEELSDYLTNIVESAASLSSVGWKMNLPTPFLPRKYLNTPLIMLE